MQCLEFQEALLNHGNKLGVSSMLGSKTAVTILNRLGHTVSYDECKRLETEIAYTCTSGELETPVGLILQGTLATGESL